MGRNLDKGFDTGTETPREKPVCYKKVAIGFLVCTVILAVAVVSCDTPMSKESYLERYGKFINEVSANYKTYNDKQWHEASDKYKKFSGDWYRKFEDDFTFQEQIKLKAWQVNWNYCLAVRYSSSTIDTILKLLKVDDIKEQVKFYIDNNMQDDLQRLYDEACKAGSKVEKTVTDILKDMNVNIDKLKEQYDK
jgi:hypothetical protein